jgi:hypothetical protein
MVRKLLSVAPVALVVVLSLLAISEAAYQTLSPRNVSSVPLTISYQGRLTDSQGHALSGNHTLALSLYSQPGGGVPLWTEIQSVAVNSGIFSIYLGDVVALPLSIFNGQTLYLGVAVDADPEMTPRLRFASVPYAVASQYAPPCAGGICNGTCVNLETDVNNCGSCGLACAFPNATSACSNSICVINSCNAGYGNCDNIKANGCEVNLTTNPSHCGSCGAVCNLPNATAACMSGTCTVSSCYVGFGNCNGISGDGCEVNLMTNPSHCGSCGTVCNLPHTSISGCTAGVCTVSTCQSGYGNCDQQSANGCETDLLTNSLNCGSCGNRCSSGQSCVKGSCQ